MKKAYKGYTIDVMVTRRESRSWTAKIWIGPILEIPKSLREMGKLEDNKTKEQAKQAGLLWGEKQINSYIEKSVQLSKYSWRWEAP